MAHQDVTRTVKVEVQFFLENNNAANILHAKATGPVTLLELDDLAGVVNGWLSTDWAPLASTAWYATGLILTDLNSLAGPRKSYPIAPPIEGTVVSDPEPANVTVAIKADVGHRGKGINGRVFWIGLCESQVVGNIIGSPTVTSIIDALDHLNTLVAALGSFDGLCVPHLVVGGIRPPIATSDLITGFLATDNSVDSQKDRLPFHKKHKRYPIA